MALDGPNVLRLIHVDPTSVPVSVMTLLQGVAAEQALHGYRRQTIRHRQTLPLVRS